MDIVLDSHGHRIGGMSHCSACIRIFRAFNSFSCPVHADEAQVKLLRKSTSFSPIHSISNISHLPHLPSALLLLSGALLYMLNNGGSKAKWSGVVIY